MSLLDSLVRGGYRGLRRRGPPSFPTYVTSKTPSFPHKYFPPVRDTSAIANALLFKAGAGGLTPRPALHRSTLSLYEDRRQWHPDAVAPARSKVENLVHMGERTTLDPKIRRRVISDPLPVWWPVSPFKKPRVLQQARLAPIQYGFMNPRKVIICLKRKMRREIAHALGFAGSSHNKKPRYNYYSYIRC